MYTYMHTNNKTPSLILAMVYTVLYTNRDLPSPPPSCTTVSHILLHSMEVLTSPSAETHVAHLSRQVLHTILSRLLSDELPLSINDIQTTPLLYTSSLSHTHKRVAACLRSFLPWQSFATLLRGLTIEFTKPSDASVLTTLQKPRARPGSRPAATMEQWPLVGRGVRNPAQSHRQCIRKIQRL